MRRYAGMPSTRRWPVRVLNSSASTMKSRGLEGSPWSHPRPSGIVWAHMEHVWQPIPQMGGGPYGMWAQSSIESSLLRCYAPGALCMYITWPNRATVEEVVTAWRNHISFPFGVVGSYSWIMVQNLKMIYLGCRTTGSGEKDLHTSIQAPIEWSNWGFS